MDDGSTFAVQGRREARSYRTRYAEINVTRAKSVRCVTNTYCLIMNTIGASSHFQLHSHRRSLYIAVSHKWCKAIFVQAVRNQTMATSCCSCLLWLHERHPPTRHQSNHLQAPSRSAKRITTTTGDLLSSSQHHPMWKLSLEMEGDNCNLLCWLLPGFLCDVGCCLYCFYCFCCLLLGHCRFEHYSVRSDIT